MAEAPIVNAWWSGGVVVLTTRTPDGESTTKKIPAEHVGYIKSDAVTEKLERALRSDGRVLSMRTEGDWLRIRFRDKWGARDICYGLENRASVPTFEGDVNPVARYLADSGAKIAKPKRCYFDIETDSRQGIVGAIEGKARVLAWAIVGEDGERVCGVLEEDTNKSERELLLDFWHELARYEQVVGWNEDRFDKPVLLKRSEYLKIQIESRQWLWLDHLVIFKKMNVSASESGDEKQSMALDAVAQAILGRGKLEGVDGSKTWELWLEDRGRLVDYCLTDTELMPAIEEVTGYLDLHFAICEVCGVLPDTTGAAPTRFVDGYLLRKALSRGMHFPTKFKNAAESEGQFLGAYVMDPSRTGIVDNVHVCDFASLYPSIIISWNMSPETYADDVVLTSGYRPSYLAHVPPERRPIPDGHCAAPDDTVFRIGVKGMICEALEEILELRKYWSKKRDSLPPGTPEWKEADRRSMAYKIAANSFYGVLGNEQSRYYVRAVAQAVTQAGAFLIKETMKAAEARGWAALYGDTDSCFITGCTVEEFRAFTAWCNTELYPKLLADLKCPINRISLAYEKAFARLVMISKKRYAGRFLHYKGTAANEKSKPEVKGLEYKRGDTARLARTMQAQCLDMLLGGGIISPRVDSIGSVDIPAYVALVESWRDRILTGPLELKELRLSKRLSRDLKGYAVKAKKDGSKAAQPPHVQVAHELAKRGQDMREGVQVEYVVTDAADSPITVIPAADYAGECDRHYLWETLAWPPTERVLAAAFPGHDWKPYDRTRPPRLRGRAAKAEAAGQKNLF